MLTRRGFLLSSAALVAASCAPEARPGDGLRPIYAYPARNEWPPAFAELKPEVQAEYRYAAANRDVLRYMPCFCGCVNGGHASNFDCYVREVSPDGRIRLDAMSFG